MFLPDKEHFCFLYRLRDDMLLPGGTILCRQVHYGDFERKNTAAVSMNYTAGGISF